MHYKQEVFTHQYSIVDRFIYHLTYYRTLNEGYTKRRMRNEFWYMTIEAHLFTATMNWCMIFGSDGCNPTHWKQLSLNEQERLAQSFREGLLQEIELDEKHWRRYWKSMINFRNKFVAHRELHFSDPVPNFDTALAVAYYYDRWVRKIISPYTLGEPSLERFAMSLKESATPLVDTLLKTTEECI